MRVDRTTRAAHTTAMLDAAGRLFRGRGLAAVRVADVTRAAGLTHGAFYGHYPSKAALAEAACRQSLLEAAARWRARAARAQAAGADPLRRLVEVYLTEPHRDNPADGCTLTSLGAEAARDPALRAALADGSAALALVLEELIAACHPATPRASARAAALAMLAAMVGGIALARANAADPEASRTTLAAAAVLALRAADGLPDASATKD